MAILSEVPPELPASELESLANKAALDGVLGRHKYEEAVSLYSRAIVQDSTNAVLYARRSAAHFKLGNFTDAINDGKKSTQLDSKSTLGYYWSGEALFQLEEYTSAKSTFMAAKPSAKEQSIFHTCIAKCNAELEFEASSKEMDTTPGVTPITSGIPTPAAETTDAGRDADASQVAETPALIYRNDFYNTANGVVITIYAKGVATEDLEIDYGEQMLSVVRFEPGTKNPIYTLQPRLYAKIIPTECKFEILKTKIEIRLKKADASVNWKSLEFSGADTTPAAANFSTANKESVVPYPTSAKRGPAKWDKIEAEVKEEEKEASRKGEGGPDSLFQMIYKDADEETRRAMNKSFVESNGTVLSTNWKEVGSSYQTPYQDREKDKDSKKF